MTFRRPWSKLSTFYQRKSASVVFRRPFTIKCQTPLISFTFDDFPRSALTTGGAILNRFGLAGTYFASLGMMGKDTASGRIFTADDLKTLFEHGHELGCHTFSHCDSWKTDGAVFESSILRNRVALHELVPATRFETFAYPISLPRPLTKARIADYFMSCRGAGQTINSGTVDLNQLSAFFLERSRHDIQAVKDLIDRNRQARGWLIFATHDVSDDPTPFGCTPAFLETVVRYAVNSGAKILPVIDAMESLGVPRTNGRPNRRMRSEIRITARSVAKPLVSILIPAFNAERWIRDTLRSAISQSWERKEIIVVDDGSTDNTVAVALQFESDGVRVVTQRNQGAAAARNTAFSLCKGDYIQWLDADDLLAPDKITKQMAARDRNVSPRTLLSAEFGKFLYQSERAQFLRTELWEDLSPTEWLFRKMQQNLFMQTATWLVSRELTEAAGPWDTRMLSDDDGEYFCRVLMKSDGTHFVPQAKVYYRGLRYDSLAYVGTSNKKRDALWLSMQLHVDYLRSLEDSPRTREACLSYIQRNLIYFYPERPDIVRQADEVAGNCGGALWPPRLSWKYAWIKSVFGWTSAKNAALQLRRFRWSSAMSLDRAVYVAKNQILPLLISDAQNSHHSEPQDRSKLGLHW